MTTQNEIISAVSDDYLSKDMSSFSLSYMSKSWLIVCIWKVTKSIKL